MSKSNKNNKKDKKLSGSNLASSGASGRRAFLRVGARTGFIGAVTTLAAGSAAHARPFRNELFELEDELDGLYEDKRGRNRGRGHGQGLSGPMTSDDRSTQDHARRVEICREYVNQAQNTPPQPTNGDEARYSDQRYYASFTKTLPSNAFGEVNPQAFEALVQAMETKSSANFDAIPLAAVAQRKLANPQGAFKFQSCGIDGHAPRIAASHRFNSAKLAGEMVEVYWQALTRDIPYANYETNNLINKAVQDLNRLSKTPAQANNGATSTLNIFRGETPGDVVGPYISQFLWQDFNFGPLHNVQRYSSPLSGSDFMTTEEEWLQIQKGASAGQSTPYQNKPRYIFNNRTLAEYVHQDVSFQAYLHAALILLGYGVPALDPGNPYLGSANQGAFMSHGAPYILDMVTRAAEAALHAAWYQKWSAHRFLRPEALGGRVHYHITGERNYDLHADLLNAKALDIVSRRQGNHLLSQAYPEGSPTHPSYPAGHGCIAGACVTVLKALFNEDFVIPNPVVADRKGKNLLDYSGNDLSVGAELNKLASNISLGRDAAGVHYRQDGIQGMIAGEQVAIAMLQEQSSGFNESNFGGYQFVNFAGEIVSIRNGTVSTEGV